MARVRATEQWAVCDGLGAKDECIGLDFRAQGHWIDSGTLDRLRDIRILSSAGMDSGDSLFGP